MIAAPSSGRVARYTTREFRLIPRGNVHIALIPIVPILLAPLIIVVFVILLPVWFVVIVVLGVLYGLAWPVDKLLAATGASRAAPLTTPLMRALRWVITFGGLTTSMSESREARDEQR
jgi:hypothetical protein